MTLEDAETVLGGLCGRLQGAAMPQTATRLRNRFAADGDLPTVLRKAGEIAAASNALRHETGADSVGQAGEMRRSFRDDGASPRRHGASVLGCRRRATFSDRRRLRSVANLHLAVDYPHCEGAHGHRFVL